MYWRESPQWCDSYQYTQHTFHDKNKKKRKNNNKKKKKKKKKTNVKKIVLETKNKMGVSVLLRLFISSNEVCKADYALYRIHEQNSIS